MKRLFVIGYCLLCFFLHATAQSLYQVNYHLTQTDTITYKAFLVLFNDGTGIARVKFNYQKNNVSMLVHANLQQQAGNNPLTVSDTIYYNLEGERYISGNAPPLPQRQFSFVKNASGEYEPFGVVGSTGTAIDTFKSVQFIDAKSMDEALVLQFFTRTDEFYKSLFTVKTRDLNVFEKRSKLNLLVVANSNDAEIGASCKKDMERVIETYTNLANFIGIGIDVKAISGTEYNKANVVNAIDKLTPSSNDIVVFYYSGHGFRKPKDNRTYPYIDLRPKPDDTYMVNSLNMEDIYSSIRKKKARFNLVLSDCCNTEVSETNAIGSPIARTKSLGINWSQNNCLALFMNPKPMSVLATAARPDQRAASNNEFGGFFSYFFKTSMETHFSFLKLNVNWQSVLEQARKQTEWKAEHTYCSKPYIPENICDQTPTWRIEDK